MLVEKACLVVTGRLEATMVISGMEASVVMTAGVGDKYGYGEGKCGSEWWWWVGNTCVVVNDGAEATAVMT